MTYIPLEKKIAIKNSLTFDDVLLLPGLANFDRSEVDFTVNLHPKIKLNLPVISSPMDTVTAGDMALKMALNGGLGVIHRNLEIKDQLQEVKRVKEYKINPELRSQASLDENQKLLVAVAVGISIDIDERLERLVKAGVNMIVIDSAHGHSKSILNLTKKIKHQYPEIPLCVGNIATSKAAEDLISAGADILRVGMGPGSICTTRIVTGMGVPQLTAIDEVVKVAKKYQVAVIADGGIKQLGDIAKALAFGADVVMLGSMLAGFEESPGEMITIEDKHYKTYRGMGSIEAMKEGAASRYGQAFDAKKLIAEGVEGVVPFKGKVRDFLIQLRGSLRSSCYDTGVKEISQFYEKSKIVRLSSSSMKESHPHSISITNTGGNYVINK